MVDIVSTVNQPQFHYINPSNDAFIQDYGSLIQTIDKNNLIASQQYTKIDQMLAQMDVNDADKWIIDESKKRLNKVVQDGSNLVGMGTSINDLIRYEGDMLVDPLLKQAVINQQKWRTEEAAVNARQDLPENMKEWYLNKYNYKGINVEQDAIVDDNGEIVGYKEWNEPFKLAEHVQDAEVVQTVLKQLNYDSYYNQEGIAQFINDGQGGQKLIETGNIIQGNEYLTEKKVKDAFISTINRDNRFYLSYLQEYYFEKDTNKLNQVEGNNINCTASQGMDFNQWLEQQFEKTFTAIAFNRTKDISSGNLKAVGNGNGSGYNSSTELKLPFTYYSSLIHVKTGDGTFSSIGLGDFVNQAWGGQYNRYFNYSPKFKIRDLHWSNAQ